MIWSIRSTTIFQGQQYSSCPKAGGCRAAELLRGFCKNLLIVSRATPMPECPANFPGNRCSQPLILRPYGRSGQELPAEYQVEARFIIFWVSKACFSYSTGTKIIQKPHRKNQLFMCLLSICLDTRFRFVFLRIRGRLHVVEELFLKKIQKITKL